MSITPKFTDTNDINLLSAIIERCTKFTRSSRDTQRYLEPIIRAYREKIINLILDGGIKEHPSFAGLVEVISKLEDEEADNIVHFIYNVAKLKAPVNIEVNDTSLKFLENIGIDEAYFSLKPRGADAPKNIELDEAYFSLRPRNAKAPENIFKSF